MWSQLLAMHGPICDERACWAVKDRQDHVWTFQMPHWGWEGMESLCGTHVHVKNGFVTRAEVRSGRFKPCYEAFDLGVGRHNVFSRGIGRTPVTVTLWVTPCTSAGVVGNLYLPMQSMMMSRLEPKGAYLVPGLSRFVHTPHIGELEEPLSVPLDSLAFPTLQLMVQRDGIKSAALWTMTGKTVFAECTPLAPGLCLMHLPDLVNFSFRQERLEVWGGTGPVTITSTHLNQFTNTGTGQGTLRYSIR